MIRHVTVVVPAADEAERIGACLTSLVRAVAHLRGASGGRVSATLLVVLDDCRDRTADVVANFPEVRTVAIRVRRVGVARQTGAARVRPPGLSRADVWVANTDADTQVPTDWLSYMVDAADAGADVVLGTVRPDSEIPRPLRHAWQQAHRLTDGHPHVHGANLGIRASTLHQLGGWAPLATGEDVDIVARAAASGTCILRTGAIAACTSARVTGRAPAGFSSYLRALGCGLPAPRQAAPLAQLLDGVDTAH